MKIVKNLRNAAIALAAIFTLSLTASATGGENPAGVEFKFIGKLQNQPLLQVTFNNQEETEFLVQVIDEYDNVLYKDYVKANNTTKKFVLNTEELGDIGVRFEITGRKSNKTSVFSVSRNSRVIEDLAVNQVK